MVTRHSRIITSLLNMLKNYDSGHRQRHAAAIVDKNRVLSYGFNSLKTRASSLKHTNYNHSRACTHAEFDAIRRLPDVTGLTLYVVSLGKNNSIKNSKPCEDCQRLISRSKLKRIIYTNGDGSFTVVTRNELAGE